MTRTPSSIAARCHAVLAIAAALCLWLVPTEWVGGDDEASELGWQPGSTAQDDDALQAAPTYHQRTLAHPVAAIRQATPLLCPPALERELAASSIESLAGIAPAPVHRARAPPG